MCVCVCVRAHARAHTCTHIHVQNTLKTAVPRTAPRAFHRDSFNHFKGMIMISPLLQVKCKLRDVK